MRPKLVFKCANEKCTNSMDATGLNEVKLKVLRRVPKICEKCGQRTMWHETFAMFSNEKQNINRMEAKTNAKGNFYGD